MNESEKENLEISDGEFESIRSLFKKLQAFRSVSMALRDDERALHESLVKQVAQVIAKIQARGVAPLAAVARRCLLTAPVTDETVLFLSAVRVYVAGDREQTLTKLDANLYRSFDIPFSFGVDFQIPVSEWIQLAELARQTVLSYLDSKSLDDSNFKAKYQATYKLKEAVFRQLTGHPVYGKRLLDSQFK